jgi:mitochondrial import receptor subunit TOM40
MFLTRVKSEEKEIGGTQSSVLGLGQFTKALPLYFEQFGKEWQALTAQDNFDGFRLEAGKAVTKNLQASHSLILGTNLRECGYLYQFGPTWHSVDGRTFATARLGLDGALNGRFGTKFGSSVELKVSTSSSLKEAQRNGGELELGYLGEHNTAALKLVHQGTWIMNGSYTQEITDNLWAGSELTYIPMNGISLTSFGARWVNGPHVFSGTVGQQPDFKARSPLDCSTTSKIQYVKKVSDRLSLGAEVETSFPDKDSALRLGYEYSFRQAKVQGLVDTAGRVSCFVSDYMGFGVSGAIDYLKGDYKFGFMMHIVPQPDQ